MSKEKHTPGNVIDEIVDWLSDYVDSFPKILKAGLGLTIITSCLYCGMTFVIFIALELISLLK